VTLATSASGDVFGLSFCGITSCIVLPDDYESETALTFSAEFDGESFASLGITATSPISLGLGENEINLSFAPLPAVVPLPATLPFLGAALVGVGAVAGRRRNAARRAKAA
jgi:hypothetical protein